MSAAIPISRTELTILKQALEAGLKVVNTKLSLQEEERKTTGGGVSTHSTCSKKNAKKPIPKAEVERKLAQRRNRRLGLNS